MSLEEILTYWRILKKRLWLVAVLILVTVVTIFFQQYTTERMYVASVRFQITEPPRGDVTLFKAFPASYVRNEIPFIKGNFFNVLTSGSVAQQVIEKLDLQNVDVADITSSIETEEIESSDFVRVKVSANDPQLAADIANAVLEEALRQYGQLQASSATKSRKFITAELETSQRELQQAQDALIAFKIENRVGFLDGMISQQQELLRSLRSRRDEVWVEGSPDKAQGYDEMIAQREVELQDLVRLSAQNDALEADVQHAQETYNFLLGKETEAKLTENEVLTVGFIQVLGEARPPSKPLSPYNFKVMALGGIVSLVIGVVLAFVWEFMASAMASEGEPEGQVVQGIARASTTGQQVG